ncbi:MAG: cytochrome c peroxidase [Candidatus Competibacteraceae bacterium]|jgi:cytochrome c peroxidase|nr:cytochrome c peroxidase [Candidatus Competibacteraceae bacterium]
MNNITPFVLRSRPAILTILLSLLLISCGGDSDNNSITLDSELRALIRSAGLSGDPSRNRTLPSIDDPLPQLGKLLFFTKALGGDKDSACVSCHHPILGSGDDLPLPIGVGAEMPDLLGPGRLPSPLAEDFDGGPTVPRNAPTIFNMALWDRVLFFDGRIESLGKTPGFNGDDGLGIRTPDTQFGFADPEVGPTLTDAQAFFPVTSAEEMRGFVFEAGNGNAAARAHLQARIGDYGIGTGELPVNFWLEQFRIAFNDPAGTPEALITYRNIALALAEYERSQIFVNTPWKAYVEGNDFAISRSAKRGGVLFLRSIDEGGAGCATCHSGDFFTDEEFYVLAIPQVGRGKGDGATGDDDFGRMRETGNQNDRYAFRTPTLLNVGETGPFGHTGVYDTLEGIVRHHLNAPEAAVNFDYNQLDPGIQRTNAVANTQAAVDQLLTLRVSGRPVIQDVALNDGEIEDIVNFLSALTDPCVQDRDCLAPWIPDASAPDPDGLRVFAIDGNGDPL